LVLCSLVAAHFKIGIIACLSSIPSWVKEYSTLGGIIYGTLISVIPVLVGIIVFGSQITNLAALIACFALSSLAFSALGILFASI